MSDLVKAIRPGDQDERLGVPRFHGLRLLHDQADQPLFIRVRRDRPGRRAEGGEAAEDQRPDQARRFSSDIPPASRRHCFNNGVKKSAFFN